MGSNGMFIGITDEWRKAGIFVEMISAKKLDKLERLKLRIATVFVMGRIHWSIRDIWMKGRCMFIEYYSLTYSHIHIFTHAKCAKGLSDSWIELRGDQHILRTESSFDWFDWWGLVVEWRWGWRKADCLIAWLLDCLKMAVLVFERRIELVTYIHQYRCAIPAGYYISIVVSEYRRWMIQ